MKYFWILLFVSTITVSAQYTQNDKQLAATTFTRNFDKVTATEYLKSGNDEKVIAGLLSVSHSEDTNFIPIIISLPLNKFAREICFALGQLGPSSKSSSYLKKVFYQTGNDPLIKYYALITLGKTADSTFVHKLVVEYNKAQDKSEFNGISLAMYYFHSRRQISPEQIRPVLENELYYSSSRQFEAAFCLYRTGPSQKEKGILTRVLRRILEGKVVSSVTEKPIPYLLACLRKLQFFPNDFNLIKKLEQADDFQTRIEVIRASAYYNYKTKEELDFFLSYLDDANKNLSREAASAIKNLHLSPELMDYLYLKLSERIHQDTDMEKYTQGELFMSYLSLFPEDFSNVFVKFFTDKLSPEYVYKICSLYPGSMEGLKILTKKYYSEKLPERITILESVLYFNQTYPGVRNILLSALGSEQPALISVASDGIDSSFIIAQKDTLTKLVLSQTENHVNDPRYVESLMSMENLSGKISPSLRQSVRQMLSISGIYSVQRLIAEQNGKSIRAISKNVDDFNIFWDNAFKYKQAEIETDKGSFTLAFFPGYAPVTVGSFCNLAKKNFFNGVTFHRVVPGFVIQGGDPTGTGWGGPGYEIISEFSPLDFNIGMVGMASAGKDTEGSQWFVTTGNYPHLDGKYTIFAEVLDGMEVVNRITKDTKILGVNLIH
jgi:cyclophilin family peptidyl-prolyl cis-trans isomerase